MNELLHLIVPFVGQFVLQPVNPRMAIARWITLGQPEFYVNVCSDVHESSDNLASIRIELPKVRIEDFHGIKNLRVADVLLSIVVDHMKNNRNDVHLTVAPASLKQALCRCSGRLFCRYAGLRGTRVGRIKSSLSVWLSAWERLLRTEGKAHRNEQHQCRQRPEGK